MANYYVNEAVFDLPERSFVDRTVHALEAKLPNDETLAVFVHRRPIEGDKKLHKLVEENVSLNEMRLSGYAVLDQLDATVGGVPAILLRTRWRHEGSMFYQLQAHVVFDKTLMIFAVSGPATEQAACDETFECIVQTITWRAE